MNLAHRRTHDHVRLVSPAGAITLRNVTLQPAKKGRSANSPSAPAKTK